MKLLIHPQTSTVQLLTFGNGWVILSHTCNYVSMLGLKLIHVNIWYTSCEIGLMWVLQNLIDDKSALVKVMAWCPQCCQQAINQAIVDQDQCHHLASLAQNELNVVKEECELIMNHFVVNYSIEEKDVYSRIPLSRAPLTCENQLVALAPWTPNFSDATLATAHMTDR